MMILRRSARYLQSFDVSVDSNSKMGSERKSILIGRGGQKGIEKRNTLLGWRSMIRW